MRCSLCPDEKGTKRMKAPPANASKPDSRYWQYPSPSMSSWSAPDTSRCSEHPCSPSPACGLYPSSPDTSLNIRVAFTGAMKRGLIGWLVYDGALALKCVSVRGSFQIERRIFFEWEDFFDTYGANTLYSPNMCSFGICRREGKTTGSTESRSGLAPYQILFRNPCPCTMASAPGDSPQSLQFDPACPDRNTRNINTSMP